MTDNDMESTPVIIVGAGPAGLALGLALGRLKVKSIILEQTSQPDQDPRGVYLNGDAVRILWALGIREREFGDFAGEPEALHFYKTNVANPDGPFYTMQTKDDFLSQALPGGVTHVQPKMEACIAAAAVGTGFCAIRRGCTVNGHELLSDARLEVTYLNGSTGLNHQVRCNYLVGADGKRGIVRKAFLEPTTPIRQVSNPKFQYEGTWIAANLQLTLPTRETQPDFPLWGLGYTPQAVYDLFCPKEWYFCAPPGKPTAGGRFGPGGMRFWRHEFAQPDWNDAMDAEKLFWEHFIPFITRTQDKEGRPFACGAVTYPRDCIEVLRCRAFTFTHKVVNQWFDRRRILIGDAAHVFPPFGGQGIASGLRDAHQLAWRIALFESIPGMDEVAVDEMLGQWARERRQSIDAATFQTKLNGQLCNEPETWGFYLFRKFLRWYERLPLVPSPPNPVAEMDRRGFTNVRSGFFLPEYGGGPKYPQVFIESYSSNFARSDDLLAADDAGLMKLLVLSDDSTVVRQAADMVNRIALPKFLLGERSAIILGEDREAAAGTSSYAQLLPATPQSDSDWGVRSSYRKQALREWLGEGSRYAILRPDFHIFALLTTATQLEDALQKLKSMVSASRVTSVL